MSNIQAEIKHYSSQAAKLSKQAQKSLKERDFNRRRVLMKQAYEASQNCQSLIEQYQQNLKLQSKS